MKPEFVLLRSRCGIIILRTVRHWVIYPATKLVARVISVNICLIALRGSYYHSKCGFLIIIISEPWTRNCCLTRGQTRQTTGQGETTLIDAASSAQQECLTVLTRAPHGGDSGGELFVKIKTVGIFFFSFFATRFPHQGK